jgi:hypothetical protein
MGKIEDAIRLAISVMKSEAEMLDQMERMGLGNTRDMANKLDNASDILQVLLNLVIDESIITNILGPHGKDHYLAEQRLSYYIKQMRI